MSFDRGIPRDGAAPAAPCKGARLQGGPPGPPSLEPGVFVECIRAQARSHRKYRKQLILNPCNFMNPLTLSKASGALSGRVVEGRHSPRTARPSTSRPGEAPGRSAQGERCGESESVRCANERADRGGRDSYKRAYTRSGAHNITLVLFNARVLAGIAHRCSDDKSHREDRRHQPVVAGFMADVLEIQRGGLGVAAKHRHRQ